MRKPTPLPPLEACPDGLRGKSVYVVGPMRGIESYNYASFQAAQEALQGLGAGLKVTTPIDSDAELGISLAVPEHQLPMKKLFFQAVQRVVEADFLIALPGYIESTGTMMECLMAEFLGKPVFLYGSWQQMDLRSASRGSQSAASLPFHERIIQAIQGDKGPHQQALAIEGLRMTDLLLRKNSDYGSTGLSSPALAPHISPVEALSVRLSDKVSRFGQLMQHSPEVKGESLLDTARDGAGYFLLLAVALQAARTKQAVKGPVFENCRVVEPGSWTITNES